MRECFMKRLFTSEILGESMLWVEVAYKDDAIIERFLVSRKMVDVEGFFDDEPDDEPEEEQNVSDSP